MLQWGNYLTTALPDPGNQLCTDDFEGPSPHNANLAAKGIVALEVTSSLLLPIDYRRILITTRRLQNYVEWLAEALITITSTICLSLMLPDGWNWQMIPLTTDW